MYGPLVCSKLAFKSIQLYSDCEEAVGGVIDASSRTVHCLNFISDLRLGTTLANDNTLRSLTVNRITNLVSTDGCIWKAVIHTNRS